MSNRFIVELSIFHLLAHSRGARRGVIVSGSCCGGVLLLAEALYRHLCNLTSTSKVWPPEPRVLQHEIDPATPSRCWPATHLDQSPGCLGVSCGLHPLGQPPRGRLAKGTAIEVILELEALDRALGHRRIDVKQHLIHKARGASARPSLGAGMGT